MGVGVGRADFSAFLQRTIVASQQVTRELRIVVEELVRRPRHALAAYTRDLVHLMADSRPPHFDIELITSAGRPGDLEQALGSLPPISGFQTSFMPRGLLEWGWAAGMAIPIGYGMTHAPSLFAPTIPHDTANDPGSHLVVTLHDMAPWRSSRRGWADGLQNALLRRAWRHADAVIVPTHAMARQLNEIRNFGTRVHVISPASSSGLWQPTTAAVATSNPYVVLALSSPASTDVAPVLSALVTGLPHMEIRVVVDGVTTRASRRALRQCATEHAGISVVESQTDSERADEIRGAAVVVDPSPVEARPQAVIDAMCASIPIVVADTPGLVEIAGDAALTIPRDTRGELDLKSLVDHVATAVGGGTSVDKRRRQGLDQAQAFEPQDVGRRLWRLHGDLVAY